MLAGKELRRRPVRTALTAAGVAAGVTSYLLLVGSAQGLLRQYGAATSFFGADVVVQQSGVTSVWGSTIAPEDVAELGRMRGVVHLSRIALGKTKLVGSPYFLVFGLDPKEALIGHVPLRSGRAPFIGADEILLGTEASFRLRTSVGGTLDVRGRTFTVSGVYATGLAMPDSGGIVDLSAAQQLFNHQQVVNLVFLNVAGVSAGTVAREIATRLPRVDAILAGGWASSFGHAALIDGFARFLAGLAVLLSALGVAVILQMSAVERTSELAILRAIGWSRGRVARLVLAETVLVTLLGFVLAALFSEAFLAIARSSRFGYAAAFLPPHLSPRLLAEALGVSTIAGSLGSLGPLIWAVRVAPARALRAA